MWQASCKQYLLGKGKKERKWTCIVPIVSITLPLSAQMWITQSYLQIHHIWEMHNSRKLRDARQKLRGKSK